MVLVLDVARDLARRSQATGRPWWHAAYLVGLCACVTVAAVYRDRAHWPMLAAVGLSAVAVAVTVVFGLLQLP